MDVPQKLNGQSLKSQNAKSSTNVSSNPGETDADADKDHEGDRDTSSRSPSRWTGPLTPASSAPFLPYRPQLPASVSSSSAFVPHPHAPQSSSQAHLRPASDAPTRLLSVAQHFSATQHPHISARYQLMEAQQRAKHSRAGLGPLQVARGSTPDLAKLHHGFANSSAVEYNSAPHHPSHLRDTWKPNGDSKSQLSLDSCFVHDGNAERWKHETEHSPLYQTHPNINWSPELNPNNSTASGAITHDDHLPEATSAPKHHRTESQDPSDAFAAASRLASSWATISPHLGPSAYSDSNVNGVANLPEFDVGSHNELDSSSDEEPFSPSAESAFSEPRSPLQLNLLAATPPLNRPEQGTEPGPTGKCTATGSPATVINGMEPRRGPLSRSLTSSSAKNTLIQPTIDTNHVAYPHPTAASLSAPVPGSPLDNSPLTPRARKSFSLPHVATSHQNGISPLANPPSTASTTLPPATANPPSPDPDTWSTGPSPPPSPRNPSQSSSPAPAPVPVPLLPRRDSAESYTGASSSSSSSSHSASPNPYGFGQGVGTKPAASASGAHGLFAKSPTPSLSQRPQVTRQLAETAVGVREVSKQIGRALVRLENPSTIMIVTKAWDSTLIYLTKHLAFWLVTSPRVGGKCENVREGYTVYLDSKLATNPHIVSLSSDLARQPALPGSCTPVREKLRFWDPEFCATSADDIDLIITLGGDGTVLYTSWLFQRSQVPPIIPFHMGSLGFLTVFNIKDIRRVLRKIVASPDPNASVSKHPQAFAPGLRVNLRMRVTCTVWRAQPTRDAHRGDPRSARPTINPQSASTATAVLPHAASSTQVNPGNFSRGDGLRPVSTSSASGGASGGTLRRPIPTESFQVLNDLVVDRGPSPYMSQLELYGDDRLLTVVQADGLVISTPTGSTAYSLSAGGSVVHPEVPALLVTPICPHTLSFRPMMLPDSMELKILLPRDARTTAFCSFDGRHRIELRQGDYVTVTAGRFPCPTICATDQSEDWFEGLSRTLHWNERARQKPINGEENDEEGERIVREFLGGTDGEDAGFGFDSVGTAQFGEDVVVAPHPHKSFPDLSDDLGLEMHDILADGKKMRKN
ncbi:hypothetical protein HDU93_002919 [Gonapodya sp. JEL0774]|nr:hypothetical protein HDU93_002919 [Gonapodya sp. JEL0774]